MTEINKSLVYSILRYVASLKDGNNSENIDVAIQCIGTACGVRLESEDDFRTLALFPTELPEIFAAGISSLSAKTYSESLLEAQDDPKFKDYVTAVSKKGYFAGCNENSLEYMQRTAKAISKFKAKFGSSSTQSSQITKAQRETMAEEKKNEGNTAIQKKDYEKAIACYTEALQLSADGPNSHIYFSNRAAAHCHSSNYTEAVKDCEASIKLSPTYVKAFARLGLANFFLERYEAAVEAYTKAVELEPGAQAHKDALRQAKQKLAATVAPQKQAAAPGPDMGGLDMGALAGLMGGGGGAGGLAGMMNNPAMMQMAQQMMSNPAMMQQAMSMLGGGGRGRGGPDMGALAGLMGGLGGGLGGGGGGGGIPSFSGFDGDIVPASTPASTATAAAPTATASNPLLSPNYLDKIRDSEEMRDMQSDPEFAAIMEHFRAGDVAAAMREAQARPDLMRRVMKAIEDLK